MYFLLSPFSKVDIRVRGGVEVPLVPHDGVLTGLVLVAELGVSEQVPGEEAGN